MVVPIPYPLRIGGYSSFAIPVKSSLPDCDQLTENSMSTNGPFSVMVRSLLVLTRSDGSIIIAFFLDLTDAESLPLSLEKVIVIPTGIWKAGRRHARASLLDSEVLYYICISTRQGG